MYFINIIRINHTKSYNIQSFSDPDVSFGISVGENVFVYGRDCSLPRVYVQTGM